MNIYKSQQISISFHKYLPISLIFLILFLGTLLFTSQNSSIPQPTTKAQSSYPQCQQGRITSPCQCGNQIYNAGFCCYHPNANSGIWFDPSYEDILPNGCPTGNFYFVDQNNPNASDENFGTEEEPWETINHAAEVLQAGDTVLVREGVYNVGSSPSWSTPAVTPSNSGTPGNPITFKAYPGDQVTITTSGGQAAIGSNGRDYIIWDGFTVEMFGRMKGILLHTTKGCVIQNCEVIGDYIPTTDNHDGIRVDASQDTVIRNCIIHGVKGDSHNSAGFKSYGIDNIIIENCEIYNCTDGIFLKGRGDGNIVRKNVIHNCDIHAIRGYGQTGYIDDSQHWLTDTDIYQDIIYDCSMGTYSSVSDFNFKVYNNVFFNCERGSGISNVHNSASYWNNLYISLKYPITCSYEDPTQPITYSDYNDFYDYDFFRINYHNKSLPEWQNQTGFDQHSIENDPLFLNPNSYNFHLQPSSSCLNAGIDRQDYDNDGNTAESINMGAYITGNETIGLIDLSQYIVEESQPNSCASQNGVCCNENQICQNGTFISSSDCGNLCCTGECVSPSIPGDLNQDNKVNSSDFQILIQKFKETQNIETEDLNSDGIVDIKDIGILMHYWNE